MGENIINSNNNINDKKIDFLYKAIDDCQNTIRFTDTKAGAIFVLCGIVFGFVGALFKDIINFNRKVLYFFPDNHYDVLFQIILILLLTGGLVCIYLSVNLSLKAITPKSSIKDSVVIDKEINIPDIFYLFKMNPKPNIFNLFIDKNGNFTLDHKFSEVERNIKNLIEEDIKNILIVELQKVSLIKELKIQRVHASTKLFILGANLLLIKATIIFLVTVYF